MKLEFLICGSLTQAFLSQIAFFRDSLRALGGDHARARLVAVFGDHRQAALPDRWRPWYEDIEVHWAHEPGADNPAYLAQHEMRFELLDPDADISVLCDGDVALIRPLDDMAAELAAAQALGGVIAHLHFPIGDRPRDPDRDWPDLARAVLGREIPRRYPYTFAPEAPNAAPFYINYGLFAGPPALLAAFQRRDLELRPKVAALVGDWWAPQVSLALTCADLGLPTRALPLRYNYPNDPRADALYPAELGRIAVFHYMRRQLYSRTEIFSNPAAFDAFLGLALSGSDALFQAHVRRLTGGRYPYPG